MSDIVHLKTDRDRWSSLNRWQLSLQTEFLSYQQSCIDDVKALGKVKEALLHNPSWNITVNSVRKQKDVDPGFYQALQFHFECQLIYGMGAAWWEYKITETKSPGKKFDVTRKWMEETHQYFLKWKKEHQEKFKKTLVKAAQWLLSLEPLPPLDVENTGTNVLNVPAISTELEKKEEPLYLPDDEIVLEDE